MKTSPTLVFSGTSPSHKDDRDEVLEFARSNNKETFPCYDKHIIAVFTLHYTVHLYAGNGLGKIINLFSHGERWRWEVGSNSTSTGEVVKRNMDICIIY